MTTFSCTPPFHNVPSFLSGFLHLFYFSLSHTHSLPSSHTYYLSPLFSPPLSLSLLLPPSHSTSLPLFLYLSHQMSTFVSAPSFTLPSEGSYEVQDTPTYLLARDEDCENSFHSTADFVSYICDIRIFNSTFNNFCLNVRSLMCSVMYYEKRIKCPKQGTKRGLSTVEITISFPPWIRSCLLDILFCPGNLCI